MGEFFVARQHRRQGIGRRVAVELFDTFGGCWEVREMPTNTPAQRFWRRIIADYTGGAFTEAREAFAAYDGRDFIVQRFHCAGDRASPTPLTAQERRSAAAEPAYVKPARRKASR